MTDSDVKLGNNSVNKVCLGSQQMLGGNPNTFRITTERSGIATVVLINNSSNPVTIENYVSDGSGGIFTIPVSGVYAFDYKVNADDFAITNQSNRTLNCKRNWIYNKQDGEMDFVMCQFVNVAHGEQFVEINDYYYSNLYVGTIFD